MNMKKIILFGLMGLLLAACSEGDDDPVTDSHTSVSPTTYRALYEGVWTIDGITLEQTYSVSYFRKEETSYVMFQAFPYEFLVKSIFPEIGAFSIGQPSTQLLMTLSSVGYSTSAFYYENTFDNADSPQRISMNVVPAEGEPFTLAFDLLPDILTFVSNETSASCILTLKRVEITYADGQQKTLVLNPERIMTFTSTKRVE